MNYFQFRKAQISYIKKNDPSVRTRWEIHFFPSYIAMNTWYISHRLYKWGFYGLARMLSLRAQRRSGIDIHPGAQIGDNVFIDHGMGVVIGETAIIEDEVTIYQQVTLGATGNPTLGRRHPIVKKGAVIGAGAKIIGAITIGEYARVGAGSIVVKDVPADTTVVPPAARAIKRGDQRIDSPTLEKLEAKLEQVEKTCVRKTIRH